MVWDNDQDNEMYCLWRSVKKHCVFIMADHGYVEKKHVDEFFRHIVKKLGMTVSQLFISIHVNMAEDASGANMRQQIGDLVNYF